MYICSACLAVAEGVADDSLYAQLSGAPAFLSPGDALAIFVTGFRPDMAIRYSFLILHKTPNT
jgi:hypothetical protein